MWGANGETAVAIPLHPCPHYCCWTLHWTTWRGWYAASRAHAWRGVRRRGRGPVRVVDGFSERETGRRGERRGGRRVKRRVYEEEGDGGHRDEGQAGKRTGDERGMPLRKYVRRWTTPFQNPSKTPHHYTNTPRSCPARPRSTGVPSCRAGRAVCRRTHRLDQQALCGTLSV